MFNLKRQKCLVKYDLLFEGQPGFPHLYIPDPGCDSFVKYISAAGLLERQYFFYNPCIVYPNSYSSPIYMRLPAGNIALQFASRVSYRRSITI